MKKNCCPQIAQMAAQKAQIKVYHGGHKESTKDAKDFSL